MFTTSDRTNRDDTGSESSGWAIPLVAAFIVAVLGALMVLTECRVSVALDHVDPPASHRATAAASPTSGGPAPR